LAFVVAAGKRAKAVALGVVLAGPLLRTAWWFLLPQQRSLIDIAFPNVADTIAIGCYAAFNTEWCSRMAKKLPSWFVVACPLVAWGIWQSPPYLPEGLLRKIYVPFVDSLLNLFLVLFLIGTVYNNGRIARLLNARMLVFIGTISYSLYIWQQLFVQQASPSALGTIARLAAIFTVAISAHYAIEKPFLRLKDRFAVKAVAAAA
jgi:peptidoglycan/LPS O-acetylase OafA/YrhL